jgi:outer membrane biosynthesis protein TonB
MAIAGTSEISLRLEQAETSRLTWAFTFSLVLHLLVAATYYVGNEYGWWQQLHWPAWMKSAKMLTELFQKPRPQAEEREIEVPLVFVEVTPAQATTEIPKEKKFYSNNNSIAANPEPADSTVPKIDGQQTDMVKTEEVPRQKAFPLNPTPPPVEKAREEQPETKLKPTFAPGDIALAKPEDMQRKSEGQADQVRPRTLKEARALLPPGSQLPGKKMKQDGGVRHRGNISLDVQGSPFGDYDWKLIQAVQKSWYSLLDSRQFAGEQTGKVTIRFRLNSDGTISQVSETQSTVDSVLSLLCRMAIEHPAPYDAWSNDMRHKIGENYRELTFTFYYY